MQKNVRASWVAAAIAGLFMCGGCATGGPEPACVSLLDGERGLENFQRVGEANWAVVEGFVQATQGGEELGYLVTKNAYRDFSLTAEFWVSDDANSGIFLRCQDPANITPDNCYEANIFDQRPDPRYGTGGIVSVAQAPDPMPKAGGKWNRYAITAKGSKLVVMLNGVKTVEVEDHKWVSGVMALQWGRGVVKFRKVEVCPL